MSIILQSIHKDSIAVDTLAALKEEVYAAAREATPEKPVELVAELDHGNYCLDAPVVFSADEEPGIANVRLTIRPKGDLRPVISSCVRINGADFQPVDGTPYYSYQFPKGEDGKYPVFRDFYVNGSRIAMASRPHFRHPVNFPNLKDFTDRENYKGLYVPIEDAKLLTSAPIGAAELAVYVEWQSANLRLCGVDPDDTIEVGGNTYVRIKFREEFETFVSRSSSYLSVGNREMYLMNHTAFLTEPNTYVYNCEDGVLYYLPIAGKTPRQIDFRYPTLENLLYFKGMNRLTLTGLTFTGATSKYICENGYCAAQANSEKRVGKLPHAAIITSGMHTFTMTDCTFRELGGNGMLMTDNNTRLRISRNRFVHIGMSALCIGNQTTAWENPKNRSFDVVVENNYFADIADSFPTAVAFYVGMVDGLRFTHNTMERTAYSAVSIGWGWSLVSYSLGEKVNIRDADIAYNKIIDFMDVLADGAAIYVLGANCNAEHAGQFNFMHDNVAIRSSIRPGARSYYMDGSSSNWEVYRNVTSNTVLPLFSQFHVASQYTHHNYLHDNYSTDPIDAGNHAPYRDTILGENFVETAGLDALTAKYPEAAAIIAAAGCDDDVVRR